jgi:hypothetical protein
VNNQLLFALLSGLLMALLLLFFSIDTPSINGSNLQFMTDNNTSPVSVPNSFHIELKGADSSTEFQATTIGSFTLTFEGSDRAVLRAEGQGTMKMQAEQSPQKGVDCKYKGIADYKIYGESHYQGPNQASERDLGWITFWNVRAEPDVLWAQKISGPQQCSDTYTIGLPTLSICVNRGIDVALGTAKEESHRQGEDIECIINLLDTVQPPPPLPQCNNATIQTPQAALEASAINPNPNPNRQNSAASFMTSTSKSLPISSVKNDASCTELSGPQWVARFPGSKNIQDLQPGFKTKVEKFINALKAAGAQVTISATKRPEERAYLMHWSWMIAKGGYDASKVPPRAGVNINWWHGDQAKSQAAAQQMVNGYGINNLQVAPSLTSRHIEGNAIDMSISWSNSLKIKNAQGTVVLITSLPRDSTNEDLISVGKSYGVIHFINKNKDKPHWSTDGH